MTLEHYLKVLDILEGEYLSWNAPIVTFIAQSTKDPYRVLISTILSLRTKDETTTHACKRLFELADAPQEMIRLSEDQIRKAIYPVGFYRNKAKTILEISGIILDRYQGRVPDSIEELLKLKGVGRKTANLVVALGYNKPAICVDVHVHRISNRFGFVKTKSPEETEFALRKKVPVESWIKINDLMVAFGQIICKPVSPFCSKCGIYSYCERRGVAKSR